MGCECRDRMVVGFTITYAISANHYEHYEFESRPDELYLIQHYVIKFVGDLRHVGGCLCVIRFPPPIKFTATILLKYC